MLLRWKIFVTLLFTVSLHAGVIEDSHRLQQISTPRACFDTMRSLIQESTKKADKRSFERAGDAVSNVFASIDFWESNPGDLQHIAWDLYPKFVRAYSLLHGLNVHMNEFQQRGYVQGLLPREQILKFIDECQRAKAISFFSEDCDPNYLATGLTLETEELLNKSHSYLMLEDRQLESFNPLLSSLQQPITECIGTPWKVASVRVWETLPRAIEMGPNAWHTDGLPPSALKIMIYPLGASYEKGTTELQLPSGLHAVEGEMGTWVLFKNSEIVHRGLAPQIGKRLVVEITILPSLAYDLRPVAAGVNARHPRLPWQNVRSFSYPVYKKGEIIGANVGGGPNWNTPSAWINLEEVASPSNPHPFCLYPNCRFPLEDNSIQYVYTSHALEHLNMPTVYRVLSESQRVLQKGGSIVIKIPDYDKALDCWRRQDPSFFGQGWNIESVTSLWPKRGIYDCLNYRAAMIFCSFFNDAYGNPFGGAAGSDPAQAYFGPPIVTIDYLRDLIKNGTPSQITKALRREIKSKESNFHFCHQSAWDRQELTALLNLFGFAIVSFDPKIVIDRFGPIPEMDSMREISMFCWAKKK